MYICFVKTHTYVYTFNITQYTIGRVPYLIYRYTQSDYPELSEDIYQWLKYLLFVPAIFITSLLFLIRFWLFYFETELVKFEMNKKWRMAIDPINISQNWFVRNRHEWGDTLYLLKVIAFITLIFTIVSFILKFYLKDDLYSNVLVFLLVGNKN